jgi:hypothetical protein
MAKETTRKVYSLDWAKNLDIDKATKIELEKAFRLIGGHVLDLEDELGEAKPKDKPAIQKELDVFRPLSKALRKAYKAKPDRGGNIRIHERGNKLDKEAFIAMFDKPTTGIRSMLFVEGAWYAMPDKAIDEDDKGVKTEVTLHHYYHNDKAAKAEESKAEDATK